MSRLLLGLVLTVTALVAGISTAAAQSTHDVAVVDDAFEPAEVEITAGDTVRWTSTGDNPHTVTASDGSWDLHPDCNTFVDASTGSCMDSGESEERAFTEPGTVNYYCKIHGTADGQGMAGTIIVQPAGEEPATEEPTAPPTQPPTPDPTDDSAPEEATTSPTASPPPTLPATGATAPGWTLVTIVGLLLIAGATLVTIGREERSRDASNR